MRLPAARPAAPPAANESVGALLAPARGQQIAIPRANDHIQEMQILIDHISYILITLLAGMAIGWKTFPLYRRLMARLGVDVDTERSAGSVTVRGNDADSSAAGRNGTHR